LVLMPWLGVPELWRNYAVSGAGVVLLLVGYLLRRANFLANFDRGNGERSADSFVESTQPLFEEK
jgi:hypothetical protein